MDDQTPRQHVIYRPHRVIDMRKDPDVTEKWLQDRITDDPSILGLGELDVKEVERRQPGAGRLDLLLSDAESGMRYEVELQLGATDESHIIRTIEYWDLERRRYPQYEHVAVIVAENITARFFNVISLLNGQIPILAIKVSVIEVESSRILMFTRVLDHISLALEDEDEGAEATDRDYWLRKGAPQTVGMADKLLAMAKNDDPAVELNYNKHYVGLAKDGVSTNYLSLRPRKHHLQADFKVGDSEKRVTAHEELGFDVLARDRYGNYRLRLKAEDFKERHSALEELVAEAFREYTGYSAPSPNAGP